VLEELLRPHAPDLKIQTGAPVFQFGGGGTNSLSAPAALKVTFSTRWGTLSVSRRFDGVGRRCSGSNRTTTNEGPPFQCHLATQFTT